MRKQKKAGRAWGGRARLGRIYCWRVPNLRGTEGLLRGWLLTGDGIVTSIGLSRRKSSRDSESTRTCSPFRIASAPAPAPAPVAAPIAAPLPPPAIAPIAAPSAAPRPAVLAVFVPCDAPVVV